MAASKKFTPDAGCLQDVDPKLRSIFVRLVSAAEPTGTQRPAAPIRFRAATSNRQLCCLLPVVTDSWDPALSISDCAAPMDRPLYLLLHNEQVLAADPADTLYYSIANGCVCRTIAEAKALSIQGKVLLHKGAVLMACPKQLLIASWKADVYNASVPKLYGIIFEAPLLQKLLCEDISLVDSITLRSCLWGVGCYNMRDAVQLTDTSPCLRNVMPSVKARTLDLLSMYDAGSEYLASLDSTPLITCYVSP
eukprot:7788-Heterococcus_DN1.PRE.1